MKIGIMGGTLDPVHCGHVDVALQVMRALMLDQVMLLPAGDPPHKARTTNRTDRLRMAEIAASQHAGLFACDVEINRMGTTYTVDTLSEFSARRPNVEWVYIIGADTLNVVETWRNFSQVAQLCSFAAVHRPGCDAARVKQNASQLAARYGARISLLEIDGPDISSTEVRRRTAEGLSIASLVPPGVDDYIREHGLYLCDYSEAQILDKLRGTLSVHRLEHTLGVADTAGRLAARHGVDPHRARLAGLLHDCAKSMDPSSMRRLVMESVPDVDAEELETEAVLHAPAGMVLAEKEYGVRDPMILNAIRRHTLGGVCMTAMDALIYVSDFIEPGRKDFPGMNRARAAAETDIFQAMRICAALTCEYVKARGGRVHPRTLELINSTKGGLST